MTTTPERSATLTALVAAEIRALLGRLDVKPAQLARQLGENDQWLSTRLKGRTPINVNDLHRIATVLGVEVHQLLPPPDVARKAADPRVTFRYAKAADQPPTHMPRQRGNRPPGHPSGSTTPGVSRTAYVDRAGRRTQG